MVENPLHRLTDEQIEALGREFDELHEEVKADLGDRDAAYIRGIIALHRRLGLIGRVVLLGARHKPAWAVGTATLGLAKILENMEIGHNVLHGQWDWMNDPVINSSAWDWDTASTAEAWKHSHNYIHHTYTNIRGKDKDLGYEIMRIDPHQPWHPVYLRSRSTTSADGVLRVGRGLPRPRPRRDPRGREVQVAAVEGAQGDRPQGARADPEGLRRVAGAERRRRRPRSTTGSPGRAARTSTCRPSLKRAFAGHADRGRGGQRDPQPVVARDHLLRPLPGPDVHVLPGGDRGRDAGRASTSASCSGRRTSRAGRCST